MQKDAPALPPWPLGLKPLTLADRLEAERRFGRFVSVNTRPNRHARRSGIRLAWWPPKGLGR